jgi:hypothetical protein
LTGVFSRSTFLASFDAKGFCRLRQAGSQSIRERSLKWRE